MTFVYMFDSICCYLDYVPCYIDYVFLVIMSMFRYMQVA